MASAVINKGVRLVSRLPTGSPQIQALYKLKFHTYQTCLTNTPLTVCLIDSKGDAFLETIMVEEHDQSQDVVEYSFMGPRLHEIDTFLLCHHQAILKLNYIDVDVSGSEGDAVANAYYFPFFDNIDKSSNMTAVLTSSIKPPANQKEMYDEQYTVMKTNMLQQTVVLTLLGAITDAILMGGQSAAAFGMGGSIGLLYLMLLQHGVEKMESFALRLGAIAAVSYSVMSNHHIEITSNPVLFLHGFMGFIMYRFAMIASQGTRQP